MRLQNIVYMLRTDYCQPDRFIDGPPVYKPVSPFVIQLACFDKLQYRSDVLALF